MSVWDITEDTRCTTTYRLITLTGVIILVQTGIGIVMHSTGITMARIAMISMSTIHTKSTIMSTRLALMAAAATNTHKFTQDCRLTMLT